MLAAIDAGSNTLRLLIGKVSKGKVVPEIYQRRVCRLAGGFSENEGLSPAARERTLIAFKEFAETCRQFEVKQVRAVGTAAFRLAVNGKSFVSEIRDATQLPLEIISGESEAEYMATGVLSVLDPLPAQALIVDIGGGSTELVLCLHQKAVWSRSLPMGVVRLTEEHASSSRRQNVIEEALTGLMQELAQAYKNFGTEPSSLTLVGTAGTVTTLAALDLGMTVYDWRRINNYALPLSRLHYWQARLTPLTANEREELPGMESGRGDFITSGLEILLTLLQKTNSNCLTVSDFGILEGLLLSL